MHEDSPWTLKRMRKVRNVNITVIIEVKLEKFLNSTPPYLPISQQALALRIPTSEDSSRVMKELIIFSSSEVNYDYS